LEQEETAFDNAEDFDRDRQLFSASATSKRARMSD
jgi:hypothetical protein